MYGAKKLTFIPDVLYHYYLRSSSQIHNMHAKDIENLKKFLVVTRENAKKLGKYDEYKETLSAMAFTHLAISWAFMVSYNKEVNIHETLKGIIKYLDEEFPSWRKCKHYKLFNCLKKGFKSTLIWGVHLFYRMNLPIVYIWVNRFVLDVLKKEVKW